MEQYNKDKVLNDFNIMYRDGLLKLCNDANVDANLVEWFSVNNQPYISLNGKVTQVKVDPQYHEGILDKFTEPVNEFKESIPYNEFYCRNYDLHFTALKSQTDIDLSNKSIDFNYLINSKIKYRPEIHQYYDAFIANNITCLVANTDLIRKHEKLIVLDKKIFGDKLLTELDKVKATVYSARDVEQYKLMTCRAYEACLTNQILFVDKLTDPNNVILNQIFSNADKSLINIICRVLLHVDESTICENFNTITNNVDLWKYILTKQREWYFKKYNAAVNWLKTNCI